MSDQHEHGADHRFLAVQTAGAGSQITAHPEVGDLIDRDRNSAARCHNRVPDCIVGSHPRVDTHEIGFTVAVEEIGAYRKVGVFRSEEHTSELQSLMRISYAVFCLTKKAKITIERTTVKILMTKAMDVCHTKQNI